MKPRAKDADDKTPGEQHTGVTQGWQSGVGDTFPDTHAEPTPEKHSKDESTEEQP